MPNNLSPLKKLIFLRKRFSQESESWVWKQESGALIHITDAVSGAMKEASVAIAPMQSGSGDPSPENIRPISGTEEVNIFVSPSQDEQRGKKYTIQIGQTIYGGTLDAVNGRMLITMEMVSPESVDDTARSSDGSGDRYGIVRVGPMGYIKTDGNQICNMLQRADVSIGKMPAGFFKVINSTGANESRAAFHFEGLTTTEAYNEKLQQLKSANTPLQICFELEEPIEISLSPTQIATLKGENYIWSDAGDMSIEYRAKSSL